MFWAQTDPIGGSYLAFFGDLRPETCWEPIKMSFWVKQFFRRPGTPRNARPAQPSGVGHRNLKRVQNGSIWTLKPSLNRDPKNHEKVGSKCIQTRCLDRDMVPTLILDHLGPFSNIGETGAFWLAFGPFSRHFGPHKQLTAAQKHSNWGSGW